MCVILRNGPPHRRIVLARLTLSTTHRRLAFENGRSRIVKLLPVVLLRRYSWQVLQGDRKFNPLAISEHRDAYLVANLMRVQGQVQVIVIANRLPLDRDDQIPEDVLLEQSGTHSGLR